MEAKVLDSNIFISALVHYFAGYTLLKLKTLVVVVVLPLPGNVYSTQLNPISTLLHSI